MEITNKNKMTISELIRTKSDKGLTLTEMRAKKRMKDTIKAFKKRKETVIIEPLKEEINPINKDFYNLFTK